MRSNVDQNSWQCRNLRKGVDVIQAPNGLSGPYSLTPRGIDSGVPTTSPGVYILGRVKEGGEEFQVRYVGRDDEDVKRCLRQHVADWYPQFFYKYSFSSREAFEKECELYREFNPPDNTAHPARNENADV